MLKTGRVRYKDVTRDSINLGYCSGYVRAPMLFSIHCVSKHDSFGSEEHLAMSEKINCLLVFSNLFIG